MEFTSVNPKDESVIGRYPLHERKQLDAILASVSAAAAEWRDTEMPVRCDSLGRVAAQLRERVGELALLITDETGKPLQQARAEIEKCAAACCYYADHATEMLARKEYPTEATASFVACEPLGPVLAIMPWNFPFWQVFRFAAPTLAAGNVCLLKHARNVSGCALAIEALFAESNFPEGVFRSVVAGSDSVAALIGDERIAAVTLTGSPSAGRAVAARAGGCLKKTVLELGGSDPYLVLEDADLDAAVATCVASRLINTGQSCIAAKRFIVLEAIAEEFTQAVVELMRTKRQGDPREEGIDLGPLARVDLRDHLNRQVQESIAAGASCLLGGSIPEGPGAWYPPTVLTDVGPGMPAWSEELFGPAASIIVARDEHAAVRIANATQFGLGAAVFTADLSRGERLAGRLRAGNVFVNDFVRSDPRLPFGGIKASGYGRELGEYGLREFVNIKTVYLA